MKKAGVATIIIGIVLTIITAFTFFTREKVVDIGSLKISANKRHHITWSPLIGVAVIAAGGVMLLVPSKSN